MNKKDKKFCVYMHTFPNGKMYIGITSKIPEKRWQNGTGYDESHQSVMYRAIQKYGWENVKHEILFEGLTLDEANAKEKELIAKYNTFVHAENSNGYNMTLGGDGNAGHVVTEESRKRMSESQKRCKNRVYYQSRQVICDNVIYPSIKHFAREHNLQRATVNKWLKGKCKMPKEWYDKGLKLLDSEIEIQPQDKKSKDRILYDNIIFETQKDLADYLGVATSRLCLWVSGKAKIPLEIYEKGIKLLDREDNFIPTDDYKRQVFYDGKIYATQKELAKELNIDYTTLNNYLNGKTKIPKKYIEKGLKYI